MTSILYTPLIASNWDHRKTFPHQQKILCLTCPKPNRHADHKQRQILSSPSSLTIRDYLCRDKKNFIFSKIFFDYFCQPGDAELMIYVNSRDYPSVRCWRTKAESRKAPPNINYRQEEEEEEKEYADAKIEYLMKFLFSFFFVCDWAYF